MDYSQIKTPNDLKRLNISELNECCKYIRNRIIDTVEHNGGHLSSNLGATELTVALHYVFDCPTDRIVFDVGHQAYAHKLLTGRGDMFDKLRQNGGISGFPLPEESEFDAFATGHASTSLSVALGLAEAAARNGERRKTIAVIGDGALTGGLAYEALNCIGSERLPLIIVLNDNKMSISKNVGAMSKYLTRLRLNKKYLRVKTEIKRAVSVIPLLGDGALSLLDKCKVFLKRVVLSNKMFEAMGISYYGPFDGHNVAELIEVFTQAKKKDGPVIIHVITDKGKGLKSAVTDPEHSHGISPGNAAAAEHDFSTVLGEFLTAAADTDNRITAVTAAMAIGTGLEGFSKRHPDKFKDVGIAEEHAVTYCAALAAGGLKPYFAVYSTFLQRAFDELLHDVCIGNYNVTLCVDRAGVAGADGVTHQGVFDLSYLSMLPNMTVMCPTDGEELKAMLDFSLKFDKPLAIRYPKSYKSDRSHSPIEYGKWELLHESKSKVYILCAGGRALEAALEAAESVEANVLNARFIKPLDAEFLRKAASSGGKFITVEDNIRRGGFGAAVAEFLNSEGMTNPCRIIAHDDKFIDDRSVDGALCASGISKENLVKTIKILNNS